MQKTERYALNQWDPSDRILREDFNTDNAKIDAALGGMLNKMHVIWVSEPDTETFKHAGYSTVPEWMPTLEYYAIVIEFPIREEDAGKTLELYFAKSGGWKSPTFTFPAQPFLLLFFPHRDVSQPFRCLLLCEKPRYLSFDGSFQEIKSFRLEVADDQTIPSSRTRYLGWK